MPIELYIMAAVWLLIDLVCRFMLKRNLYQLYMKRRVQLAEKNGKIKVKQGSLQYFIYRNIHRKDVHTSLCRRVGIRAKYI